MTAWRQADFDDHDWERTTCDFGPQFWCLGPIAADPNTTAVDAELARLAHVNPQDEVTIAGQTHRWRPYAFSWRMGLEDDPGHQGWHGLKENVTDHFLCLGQRVSVMNEFKYEPEAAGSRYYLWTSVTLTEPTVMRIVASSRQEGQAPHASEVLTPDALYLDGQRVTDLQQPVSLSAGTHPILVRYDRAGRGYLVVKRDTAATSTPAARTPLAMTWFDDPAVVRFDVYAGGHPAEWFRFTAPPGLRAMAVTARGTVEAWADGQPMRSLGQGRFETTSPLPQASAVALRVVPQTGCSGSAVFAEPIRLDCGPGIVMPGDWSGIGAMECYSGGAWYRKSVTLSPEQVRGRTVLHLGKVVATAEVRVNGRTAGVRVAPPWSVEITAQVQPGENRIEILVFNTLANHYLTVPTHYRGDLTSGLLGPVTLELTASGVLSQSGPDSRYRAISAMTSSSKCSGVGGHFRKSPTVQPNTEAFRMPSVCRYHVSSEGR